MNKVILSVPHFSCWSTALTCTASLLRLLTCHTHDYQYWQWSLTCACPKGCCCVCVVVVVGDLLLSTSIYVTAACVKYINTNMKGDIWVVRWVCVDLSFKDHLGIHAWCAEAQPFSFCVKPTGFLCLCGSQSKLQQVRQRQTGWKRKPSSLTFNVKDDLRKKISIGTWQIWKICKNNNNKQPTPL